jgi:hypothetical protein
MGNSENPEAPTQQLPRVRVFVDYWNFQLTLNEVSGDNRFKVDWRGLGPWLANKACQSVGIGDHSFDGVIIYGSY